MRIKAEYLYVNLCLIFLMACNSGGTKPEVSVEVIDSIAESIDTVYTGTPPSEAPANSDSPFYSLGCCNDTAQRLEGCCCLEVIKKYAEMRKSNDKRIAELKQTDVILSNCYINKKYSKQFEEIDYPEGDDEF